MEIGTAVLKRLLTMFSQFSYGILTLNRCYNQCCNAVLISKICSYFQQIQSFNRFSQVSGVEVYTIQYTISVNLLGYHDKDILFFALLTQDVIKIWWSLIIELWKSTKKIHLLRCSYRILCWKYFLSSDLWQPWL